MIKIEEIENFFDNWERKNVDYKDEQYCFKYAEDTQLAYIAGFKKCRAMLKHIIHEMEQDQIDWVISMSDYGRKELEYEIRCNNCMWTGYEEDLVMYNETSKVDNTTLEFFKGCPNCKTNECLINI